MNSLFGGLVIGLSAAILFIFNGRILGVSGIIAVALDLKRSWRFAFLLGLILAGVFLAFFSNGLNDSYDRSLVTYGIAGLMVGFGTQLGSGCTSGHGICGMSRLSPRSIVATCTFILSGIATVAAVRYFGFST